MNTYEEVILSSVQVERTFHPETLEDKLVWHRDKEDRVIEVLEPTDWQFQFDNMIPKELTQGSMLYIPRNTYHRVIKGSGSFKIRITKYSNELKF